MPEPCLLISECDEAALLDCLLRCGMATLVEEHLVPQRPDGGSLLAGLFTVL